MSRLIEWVGEPFAVLVEPDNGPPFLVPPIVLDYTAQQRPPLRHRDANARSVDREGNPSSAPPTALDAGEVIAWSR